MPETILYGGSFDPPHMGHLLAAAYVLATRPGDLWLMPSARHPFGKHLTGFGHREAMCRLVAGLLGPRVSVCTIEAELPGDGRTIDTVLALSERHPERRWRLVVGSDVLHDRHAWKRWDDLVAMAPLIVLERGGVPVPEGFEPEIRLPEVSSTEVRRRLALGQSLEHLVPWPVLDYVSEHGLYRGAAG